MPHYLIRNAGGTIFTSSPLTPELILALAAVRSDAEGFCKRSFIRLSNQQDILVLAEEPEAPEAA